MQLGNASMNLQPLKKIAITLRPLSKPRRAHAHFETLEQEARDWKVDNGHFIGQLVNRARQASSTANSDVSDWVLVQRNHVPSPSSLASGDSFSVKGVGPELTVINMQLHDELFKSSAASSLDQRLCYRRCPDCHDEVAVKRGSPSRRSSVGTDEHHLGPWTPMNAGRYESDVRCIGDWAASAETQPYTDLTWDF